MKYTGARNPHPPAKDFLLLKKEFHFFIPSKKYRCLNSLLCVPDFSIYPWKHLIIIGLHYFLPLEVFNWMPHCFVIIHASHITRSCNRLHTKIFSRWKHWRLGPHFQLPENDLGEEIFLINVFSTVQIFYRFLTLYKYWHSNCQWLKTASDDPWLFSKILEFFWAL